MDLCVQLSMYIFVYLFLDLWVLIFGFILGIVLLRLKKGLIEDKGPAESLVHSKNV